MAGTLVFIFLLDHLPGNIQNKTLETVQLTHIKNLTPQTCDHTISDPLLQVISRELDVLMIPQWMFEADNLNLNQQSSGTGNLNLNSSEIVDNSVGYTKSLEAIEMGELVYEFEPGSGLNEVLEHSGNFETIDEKMNAHLVAIFESLSNVTAQTCGGTLLAPNWVLTAASCVNLLSNLYQNSTSAEESVYTVIVNASDPLTDGTAHNVTEVHIHPQPDTPLDLIYHATSADEDLVSHFERHLKPDLALMRIEPPADVRNVEIVDTVTAGAEMMVYGWAVLKNSSAHDTMRATQFPARALTPLECARLYNVTADSAELCLYTSDDNAQLVTQMSWGGPVTSGGALSAVSRADGRAPLAAWPLRSHSHWIHSIVGNS